MDTIECGGPEALLAGFRRALDGDGSVLLRSYREQDPVMDLARSVAEGLQKPEYCLTGLEDEILAESGAAILERTGPIRSGWWSWARATPARRPA